MDLGLLHSFIGKRFKQPLVLFQSDDWGLNRCGAAGNLQALAGRWPEALKTPMQRLDMMEREEDVQMLKEVLAVGRREIKLEGFGFEGKDRGKGLIELVGMKGDGGERGSRLEDNAPVFTCNAVMANMDFEESLRVGSFVQEGVKDTYKRIFGEGLGGYHALKAGAEEGVFDLQFHGAAHVQYNQLMRAYQADDAHVVAGLEMGVMGISPGNRENGGGRSNFMAALDWHSLEQGYEGMVARLKQAFLDFEGVWGKRASSFIAPAYIWDQAVEAMLVNEGIRVVQGLPYQLMADGKGGFSRRYRRMAFDNNGVFYTLRNCYFEPGENYNRDYVASCLKRMQTLIKWGVPVVINTHRFNYMGGVSEDHRAHGLKELERLILGIRKHWPQAIFVGTEYFNKEVKH